MSWSVAITIESSETPKDKLRDELAADINKNNRDEPTQEQMWAALDAAVVLIESEWVGKDCKFSVLLAGHANPEHKPRDGWSNDTITVTVTQAS